MVDLPVCSQVAFPSAYYGAFALLALGLVVVFRRRKRTPTKREDVIVYSEDKKRGTYHYSMPVDQRSAYQGDYDRMFAEDGTLTVIPLDEHN